MLALNYLVWLEIFVWVIVPLMAWLTARLVRQRAQTTLIRRTSTVAGFVILFAPWIISSGVKTYYDWQVQDLCAKDGGVRVYETVRLSRDEYEQREKKNWTLPNKSAAPLSEKYYIETDRHFYVEGYLSLFRTRHRIVRRSDGKVLGERIRYGRAGGDLPGPWNHSSFMCPDPVRQPSNFESTIFVRGGER